MRRTFIATAALAATTLLAACGSSTSGGGSSTTSAPQPAGSQSGNGSAAGTTGTGESNLSGEISFAAWGDPQIPQAVADAFMKEHPGTKVTVQVSPWGQYWTKLQTSAAAGNAADVFMMTPANFPLYADNGQLMPVDEQGGPAAAIDGAEYPKALVDAYRWNDKQYGYPKDFDTIAVFYNKKLFTDAGVTAPTDAWTWEQMVKDAQTISDKNKGKNIYGISAALWDQGNFNPTVYANGGSFISADMKSADGFTKPETVEGVQMWTDLIKSGASPTMKQMTDTQAGDWFKSGRVAIMWGGSFSVNEYGTAPALKGNLGVVEIPLLKGKRVSMINGLAPMVYAKTKNKDLAAAFAAFVEGPQAQKIWAKEVIPSLKQVQPAWVDNQKALGIDVTPFLRASEYAQIMPRSKNTDAWTTKNYDIFTKIWDGTLGVADGLKQAQDSTQELLNKEQ